MSSNWRGSPVFCSARLGVRPTPNNPGLGAENPEGAQTPARASEEDAGKSVPLSGPLLPICGPVLANHLSISRAQANFKKSCPAICYIRVTVTDYSSETVKT